MANYNSIMQEYFVAAKGCRGSRVFSPSGTMIKMEQSKEGGSADGESLCIAVNCLSVWMADRYDG